MSTALAYTNRTYTSDNEVYFRTTQASAYMKLSISTLNQWRSRSLKEGKLYGPKFRKIGETVIYKRSDIDEFMDTKLQFNAQPQHSGLTEETYNKLLAKMAG